MCSTRVETLESGQAEARSFALPPSKRLTSVTARHLTRRACKRRGRQQSRDQLDLGADLGLVNRRPLKNPQASKLVLPHQEKPGRKL